MEIMMGDFDEFLVYCKPPRAMHSVERRHDVLIHHTELIWVYGSVKLTICTMYTHAEIESVFEEREKHSMFLQHGTYKEHRSVKCVVFFTSILPIYVYFLVDILWEAFCERLKGFKASKSIISQYIYLRMTMDEYKIVLD